MRILRLCDGKTWLMPNPICFHWSCVCCFAICHISLAVTVSYTVYTDLFLLQLVVEISSVSPISLGYCANSGFISQLLGELTGDDVLIR